MRGSVSRKAAVKTSAPAKTPARAREHGVCDRGLRHERLAREVAPGGILDEGGGDDAVDLGPGQHGAPARLAAGERRPPIGSSRR